jgi:hypothetical protein
MTDSLPGDDAVNLSGQTGVFAKLAQSHEQIVEDNDATEAEAELTKMAAPNAHDQEFQEKLSRVKKGGIYKKGSFGRLLRNLRKRAELEAVEAPPSVGNKAVG